MEHFESLYPENSRNEEIKQIIEDIKGGNSAQIIGLPGVGRSNLLGLLSFNRNVRIKHLGKNQKWFHFVYCNFSEIRKKPLLEAEKFIFLSLVESLKERKISPKPGPNFAGEEEYDKAYNIFKESLALNDEMVLFQGLKKVIDLLAIEKELSLIFLFDRFEEYVPTLTSQFFTNLRLLRARAKYRFSVVFSLNRPLEDLIEPMFFADFHEFLIGHTIFLPIMDKPGLEFRISYLEKITGKKIDKNLLEKIINLTGGHGKLTRLAAEISISTSYESGIRNQELKESLLKQKAIQGAIFEIWNSLTPFEQKLIQNQESGIKNQEEFSFLENIGFIKDGEITIPLFEKFTKEQLAIKQFSNKTIVYDPSTNEIKKGDLVLSDQLTSFEFRLLKFLIENKDRIIEREEIINAVWKEAKSTEGVTDQALDQLIFRVRKKIEDDPNNPTHLQTVKGRGFRFIH